MLLAIYKSSQELNFMQYFENERKLALLFYPWIISLNSWEIIGDKQ